MTSRDAITTFLWRGPGALSSLAARWSVNLLAAAGAAMLGWSAQIHLDLWAQGYKDISVIGPLFLIQGIVCALLTIVVVAFRRLALLAIGAATLVATAAGLLLSVNYGLFGFKDSLLVPDAKASLIGELVGGGLLVVGALVLMLARQRVLVAGNPSREPSRT
jgi:hypothetical protein